MNPMLRLTIEHDADGTCCLRGTAQHDGFAGRGHAWFGAAQIDRFCDALERYPQPAAGATLEGGVGRGTTERVVTLGLHVHPVDALGGLELIATLADTPIDNQPQATPRHAVVALPMTYEVLRRFAHDLRQLHAGRAPDATLDAPDHP